MAGQLDITNGHAARMRFSRFKQHMEGVPPAPRRPRPTVPRHKKPKHEKQADYEQGVKEDDEEAAVKLEPMAIDEQVANVEPPTKPEPISMDEQTTNAEPPTKSEPIVKEEQTGDDDSEGVAEMTDSFQASAFAEPSSSIVKKQEPMVKTEVYWDE